MANLPGRMATHTKNKLMCARIPNFQSSSGEAKYPPGLMRTKDCYYYHRILPECHRPPTRDNITQPKYGGEDEGGGLHQFRTIIQDIQDDS